MAKKLNKNLVIGLAALGFAVTTAAGILMVYQLKQTDPKEFASRAEALAKQKNWKEASAYYHQAYNSGKNAEYLVLAGDMQSEAGNDREALAAYNAAVLVNPSLLPAQEKLLKIRLDTSEIFQNSTDVWREVQKCADAILELQKDHARATYARGVALLGLKDVNPANAEEGMKALQHAIELDPAAADPARALAWQYRKMGLAEEGAQKTKDIAKSEQLIRDLASKTTTPGRNAALARTTLAAFLAAPDQKKYDEAAKSLDDALAMAGTEPEVLAEVYNRTGEFWYQRWLQNAFEANKKAETGTTDAALDPANDEPYNKAVAALLKAVEVAPNEFDAYLLLHDVYKSHRDVDKAREILDKRIKLPIKREGMKAALNRYRRYRALVARAALDIDDAAGKAAGSKDRDALLVNADFNIEQALSENPNGAEALAARGRAKYTQGKYREAVLDFQKSNEQSGRTDWQTAYYLADSLMKLGQNGEANAALVAGLNDRAAASAPAYWILLARVKLALQDPKEALAATTQVLNAFPKNRDAILLRAAALEQMGNDPKPDLDKLSDEPQALAAKARVLASQGKVDEGLQLLFPKLQEDPAQVDYVRAAVLIYLGRTDKDGKVSAEDRAAAQKIAAAALAKSPDNFDLRLAALQASGKPKEEQDKEYIALLGTVPDEFNKVASLGRFYDSEKRYDEAKEQYHKAIDLIASGGSEAAKQSGAEAQRYFVDRLFQIAIETKDMAELDKLVELGAKYNLDAAEGQSFKGRRLMVDGMNEQRLADEAAKANKIEEMNKHSKAASAAFEKSITALKQAIEQFPSSGQTHAQLGEAYLQLGRSEEARAAFEQANEKQSLNLPILRRLTELSRSANDDAAARKWLAAARKVRPDDEWVIEETLIEQELDNPREVITQREKKRAAKPDDEQNLFHLAQLYAKVGDGAKAEERINELLKLTTDDAAANAAADILRGLNKPDKALQVLQQHLRDTPPDRKAFAQLLIGEHYEKLNDRTNGDMQYLAAYDLDTGPRVCTLIGKHFMNTGQPTKAREWFEKALANPDQSSGQIDRTAVRVLRVNVMLQLDQLVEAETETEQLKKDDPTNRWVLLLDAQVAQTGGRTEQALKTLESLLEKYPAESRAVLRRAEILGSLGQYEKAIQALEKLRSTDPAALNYGPRILLARAYQQVGKLDQATADLKDIVDKDPAADNVVNELVSIYNRTNNYAAADQVVTTMLNKNPQSIVWLVRAGLLAVKQKDRAKALASFTEAGRLSGYHPAVNTEFLNACSKANLGAIDEGIEYYEDAVPPGQRTPQVDLAYAKLLAERGKDQDFALENFRNAAKKDDYKNFDFLDVVIGAIMDAYGGPQKAKEMLTAKPVDPVFERVNKHLVCEVLRLTGDLDGAEAIAKELAANPANTEEKVANAMHLARIYEARNKWEEAKAQYLEVLKVDENNLIALNNIAYMVTDKLNKPKDAVTFARRAVQIAPRPEVLDTLGWAYLKDKQLLEATAQFLRARTIDPDFVPATFHLAEAFRNDGKFKESAELYTAVAATPKGGRYDEFIAKAQDGLQKATAQNKE